MGSMITGIWGSITFYCKHHPEEPMELKQGPYSAYYGCRHELDEEHPCHNRLNLIDAEKALQNIMNEINDSNILDDMVDLTNFKMTKNGIKYKVLKHDPFNDALSIEVENKKILRG